MCVTIETMKTDELTNQLGEILVRGSNVFDQHVNVGIIKFHAYTEYLVNLTFKVCIFKKIESLNSSIPVLDKLISDRRYIPKIELLKKEKVISESLYSKLYKLNEQRVVQAHPGGIKILSKSDQTTLEQEIIREFTNLFVKFLDKDFKIAAYMDALQGLDKKTTTG